MQPPARTVTRRSLLAGAGAAVLLATAACNPFSPTAQTRTQTVTAPPPIDPIDNLIASTELHVLRLESAVAKGGDIATLLNPLLVDRKAHLERLTADRDRSRPGVTPPPPAAGTIPVPADRASIIRVVLDDTATAQVQFTDAVSTVSAYRAALFSSIAACLATHRVVLR
jgi:hypothetical protein